MPKSLAIKNKEFATKGDVQLVKENVAHVSADLNSFRIEILQSIKELNDVMIQSFHFVYARFDQIDERFEKVDERFEKMDRRLDLFESGMNVRFEKCLTVLEKQK
jgi:hypothetical protein